MNRRAQHSSPVTPDQMRRRLILRQRRQIKPKRRMDVISRYGLEVTYQCRTCNSLSITAYDNEFAARQMASWHSAEKGGCSGTCKVCTKEARDRLYPLPRSKS